MAFLCTLFSQQVPCHLKLISIDVAIFPTVSWIISTLDPSSYFPEQHLWSSTNSPQWQTTSVVDLPYRSWVDWQCLEVPFWQIWKAICCQSCWDNLSLQHRSPKAVPQRDIYITLEKAYQSSQLQDCIAPCCYGAFKGKYADALILDCNTLGRVGYIW